MWLININTVQYVEIEVDKHEQIDNQRSMGRSEEIEVDKDEQIDIQRLMGRLIMQNRYANLLKQAVIVQG